ncbi:MAG: hypothetical protein IPP72_14330 [Chitinophagaceae bacterium]|nr:hypothetical protein [Chitinophagaceae bacterium]
MKRVIISILLFPALLSTFSQKKSSSYISENFVVLGIKAIRLNGEVYTREIHAKDFKTSDNSVVEGFAFGDEMFIDNGKDNDKRANDGIYTSVDTYRMKAQKKDTVILSDKVVFGINFKYEKELEKYLSEKGVIDKFSIRLKCDISSCTCSACDCIACNNNCEQSLRWCFNGKDCLIKIGFDF